MRLTTTNKYCVLSPRRGQRGGPGWIWSCWASDKMVTLPSLFPGTDAVRTTALRDGGIRPFRPSDQTHPHPYL